MTQLEVYRICYITIRVFDRGGVKGKYEIEAELDRLVELAKRGREKKSKVFQNKVAHRHGFKKF